MDDEQLVICERAESCEFWRCVHRGMHTRRVDGSCTRRVCQWLKERGLRWPATVVECVPVDGNGGDDDAE